VLKLSVEFQPHRKGTIVIQLQIHCGCGFKTTIPEHGDTHADTTGHILTLSGSITSDQPIRKARQEAKEVDLLSQQKLNAILWSEAERAGHELAPGMKGFKRP